MSASLARRLRRIGLAPTTYTETREQILVKDEQGNTITQDRIKRLPQRSVIEMSAEEFEARKQAIITAWCEKRRARR